MDGRHPLRGSLMQSSKRIAEEARSDPQTLHDAPHTTPVGRLDEVKAARDLKLYDPGALPGNGGG